ncbi:MFS transporter [Enterobacter asburiae]|uniref:MFS transporter n=1 Tax=Enterobacter asburiae TaxID=61645 RepID=UPI0027ED0912|nr:hypothetical protein EAI6_31210 [Enterobacter asburiae]
MQTWPNPFIEQRADPYILRHEGQYYFIASVPQYDRLAIAGAMVGFLLSWYGYDAGANAQSADAINGIVLLFTVIPGVGYLITAGVVRLLKVDRETMKQIQSDLEKRRSNYRELNDYQELKAAETK